MKIILRNLRFSVFFLSFLLIGPLMYFPVREPVTSVLIHDAEAFRPGPPPPVVGPRGAARRTARRTSRRVSRRHAVARSRIYTLPHGCRSIIRHSVRYYDCDGVYYRPFYEGNQVVYEVVD